MMKFFRVSYFRELLIMLTGVAFLNMSFITAEVSFFELSKYYSVSDEVSASMEDEQETGAESQANDSAEEELDLVNNFFHDRLPNISFIALQRLNSFVREMVGSTYRETFSPPPEFSSMMA